MTSFIIIAKNEEKRATYLKELCEKHHIDVLDRTIIKRAESAEKKGEKKLKQSIGITEIKQMQQKIFLTPFKSPQKAVIIEEAELLTTEAQNALLKVLEEPPDHTIIILSTNNKETLLPTIQSRCKIITLPEEEKKLMSEEITEFNNILNELENFGVGASLTRAEKLAKNKEEAIELLENLILVAREKLLADPEQINLITTIKQTQSCLTILKTTNANPRLTLEVFFLSFQTQSS